MHSSCVVRRAWASALLLSACTPVTLRPPFAPLPEAVHVVVRGRVQGVGFRAWVVRQAAELDVHGAVWNRADGGVEAEAVGAEPALRRFVAALRAGPAHARVEQVAEQWFERAEVPSGFRVTG